jgi:hypothetical protein
MDKILFVDDDQRVLDAFRRMLHVQCQTEPTDSPVSPAPLDSATPKRDCGMMAANASNL